MAKISAYECENCGFITKQKNEVFIIQGSILNGENEIIHTSDQNKMLCFECFSQSTGMFEIWESAKEELGANNEHDGDEKESDHYINETESELPIDEIKTTSDTKLVNLDEEMENFDELEKTQTSYQPINNNVELEESDSPQEDDPSDFKSFQRKDQNSVSSNEITDQSTKSKHTKADENKITEEIEKEKEKTATPPSNVDSEVEFDYIKLIKITSSNEEEQLSSDLGFETKDEFLKFIQLESVQDVCIPVSDGINDSELSDSITALYELHSERIMYTIENGVPKIKRAAVFMEPDGKTGYISNDVLNQLNRK